MSLLLDALHRASKDKEKIAASAMRATSEVPAPAPTPPQSLSLVEPLTLEPVLASTPLPVVPPVPSATTPEPSAATPEREFRLSDAKGPLAEFPTLLAEPTATSPSPAPSGVELSLVIEPAMELVPAAPEPAPKPAPMPVVKTAAPDEPAQSAESRPVTAPAIPIAPPQTATKAPTPAPASTSAPSSEAASAPTSPIRAAKEIRRAYEKNPISAHTGKRRIYILGGIALALLLVMGSFFMGWWGDPQTLLGIGNSSSLSPTSLPSASTVAQEQVPTPAPDGSMPAGQAASAPISSLSAVAVKPGVVPAASSDRATQAKTDAARPRPAAAVSTQLSLNSNELVLRASSAKSIFKASSREPGALEIAYGALLEGRIQDAAQAYEQALKVNPQEPDALLGLAYIAQRQGQREEAQAYYRRVLRQDPVHAAANAALMALEPQGSSATGLAKVRELVAQQPHSAATLSMAGNAFVREGQLSEAAQMFARAQGLEPDNLLHAYNHAVALDRLGQYGAARAQYHNVLKAAEVVAPSSRVFPLETVRLRLEQLNQALGSSEQTHP